MKTRIVIIISLSIILGLPLNSNSAYFTIPEWCIKSCVFIVDQDKPIGTGFLISVDIDEDKLVYLVTAKHVIYNILQNPEKPLTLRFNLKKNVGTKQYNFIKDNWVIYENNRAIDIAVVPLKYFNRVFNECEVFFIPTNTPTDESLATTSWIRKYNVRPGDTVFTFGLLPFLFRKDRNLVISRFGTISFVSDTDLDLPGGKQKAYFIDCPAFPGNSGSPVFVMIQRDERGRAMMGWRIALLGIVTQFIPSGLRKMKRETKEETNMQRVLLLENTGIAKVVPVDYLVEILFSGKLEALRAEILKRIRERTNEGN